MVWGSGQGKQETSACKHGVNAPASTFVMWQWGCRGTKGGISGIDEPSP